MEDYYKIFHQTAISDIISKEETLIGINKNSSVEELLSVLFKYSLSSVPVVNDSTGKSRVIGFVDTNDILTLLVKLYEKVNEQGVNEDDIRLLSIAFLHTSISNIMDISKKDQFTVVLEEQSLLEVLKLYSKGIHRVALLSVFSDIETIVSQSNVINFISNNVSLLSGVKDLKISQLLPMLVSRESLITTKDSDLTICSFKSMKTNHVSAVPVLDSNKSIVGTLSINDLYGLKERKVNQALLKPTLEFIQNKDTDPNKNKPLNPVVLKLDDTFKDAIELLSKYKVHRVWVVDEHNTPLSVISLTDICNIIVNPPLETQELEIDSSQQNRASIPSS
ncbi:hypothetical protein CYY_004242 [Polysphondylium violaceum]|uniref:CBS domain-containing protein n=1 Tax=Polysphondylium violaceum TaxID=133409 RepID=A0A8J4UZE5_9MYCE|nr:hypothetical protein CYY_004242 [Polysphondylium violaceum]